MIKEYDLGIFRSKLWVAVNENQESLSSKLCVEVLEGKYGELSTDIYKGYSEKNNAVTVRAYSKETGDIGYLVVIFKDFDKGSDLVDCLAHEACHVSDFLQADIGVSNIDTEINAHITGYVAGKEMLTWNEEKEEAKA